jgi:hypothetical protein
MPITGYYDNSFALWCSWSSEPTVYALGRVDFWLFSHFQRKYPWDLLHTFQKYRKYCSKKNRFIIGHDFLGHALYKGSKFFIHNMDYMVIKRRRILCGFQKYKLTFVTKCTKKTYSRKKNVFTTQRAPCVQTKIFILEYLFCILSLRQIYIFEIYIKFCIFWYPWSLYFE